MALFGLFKYQRDAIDKMKNGCILCGGVGSGKSRTSLAYYYKTQGGDLDNPNYQYLKDPCDLYIITTARKRDSHEWVGELSPFLLSPTDDIRPYNNRVVIDSWNNVQKYKDVTSAFFIFDEDRVTGSGAWVKAFLKIAKANKWIILSATPGDTWSDYIPVFVANGFYKNKTEFIREHIVYDRFSKYPKVDRYLVTQKLQRLRSDILIPMEFERRTTPHHERIACEYDTEAYRAVMRTHFYDNQPITSAPEFCYILRKIVNSDSSREMALLELLEKHPRAIVYYNYTYELNLLRELLGGVGMPFHEWNGEKHEQLPEGPSWVYLVQYTAGAEAWNCITTDTIIFYSQNYSYRILVQACGRIDRLNSPYEDLYYYHLYSRAPIDLAILRALRTKKKFDETKFCGNCANFTSSYMAR